MRWLKRLIILILMAALAVAALKLVHLRKQELESVKAPQKPAMIVHTARISEDTLLITRSYRGIILPQRSIALTPRIQGKIVDMQGQAGDNVQSKELLVRIDDRAIKQNIQALQAEKLKIKSKIWILDKTYNRQADLVQNGGVSQDTVDQTLSDLKQARASLSRIKHEIEQARASLDYTRLRAGLHGRVQRRMQEPGDMARPGRPVMLLEDVSAGYNVHIQVPAQVQKDLQPGQEIVLKSGDKQQKTTIERIHPATAPDSSLIEVEAHLDKPLFGLASGASLQAELQISRVSGLIVPARAVFSQNQSHWIFVLNKNNRIEPHQVKVLARNSDRVAVQGDIQPDQRIAVGPWSQLMRLSPGLLVKPVKEADL